jgi:hypothetical protein
MTFQTWKQPFLGFKAGSLQMSIAKLVLSISVMCALNQSLETCGNPAVMENPGTSPTDPLKFFSCPLSVGIQKQLTQQLLVGG